MPAPTGSAPSYAVAAPRRSSIRERNRRILGGGASSSRHGNAGGSRPARRSAPPRSPFSSPQSTTRARNSTCNNDKPQRKSHQQKHTVYIQNSSTLARREQEMLRKGRSQTQEGQTVSTRSMTTATLGSHSTLNATFDHHDDESARSFECINGTPTDKLSPQHSPVVAAHVLCDDDSNHTTSSDDESADYEEEESMDDEREWRRDDVLLEMLQEASEDEETEVYEETSRRSSSPSTASSSSGYISVEHETNSDDDDIIVDVDDDSFLNPPSMYSPRSLALKGTSSDEDMSKEIVVNKSVTSRQSTSTRNRPHRPHRHHRPPVAVVFEIDDYTSDSGALGEDSLIDFVRDFTEEMKDESTNGSVTRSSSQSNGNTLTARPSVRVYSTLGARRCDIKTMKQRVLSSETILSTILENRAKQAKDSRMMPKHQEREILNEENTASLPSNDSTVGERHYHRRQFSKEMSTEDIVSSMRGEDILLKKTPSTQKKKTPRPQNEEKVPQELTMRASLASFASTSTTNTSGPEQRFTNTLNEETDRRRRRLQELRARRQAKEQGSQPISLPTTSVPSISSANSVHSNRSSRQQQTSLRPIMHNKPPLRRNESTTTGNTGTSTPTVPTSNLTHRQGLRNHRVKIKSTSMPSASSRPATLPSKKETGLGRFFSRFSGSKVSRKEPPRAQARPMTAGAAYRAAVAARSETSSAHAYSSQPKFANQPAHAVRAPRSIASTATVPCYHIPPPAPQVQRYGGQRPAGIASSIQPRRLFDDESTCTSVWGRCFDDEAASTAKAAAAWV